MGEIRVYGVNHSPFSKRVEIALKIKGVKYEFVEEDLQNKSQELLKYNPVHKQIPVFVKDEKPIAESLVILEYIDETWKDNPLLPTDPFERAQARFWAKFIDDKLFPGIRGTISSEGEEAEKAIKEGHELLNILEKEITGKKYFGGNKIGYVDIVGIVVPLWLPVLQEAAGKDVMLTQDKYPALCTWAHQLMACDVFKDTLPPREKLLALFKARFQANPPK